MAIINLDYFPGVNAKLIHVNIGKAYFQTLNFTAHLKVEASVMG